MTNRGRILFCAGALTALGAGWGALPHALYRTRLQPVDFSHRVHAEKAGSKCEDCHALRDDGTFAGIPRLAKCAECHAAPMGTTAAEKNFIDQYVTPQREPEWAVYARQPENVYFPHGAHLKLAKLDCRKCHGDHGSTDTLRPYQEDRISGYSRDIWGVKGRPAMKMNNCVDCHREKKLERSCMECHK